MQLLKLRLEIFCCFHSEFFLTGLFVFYVYYCCFKILFSYLWILKFFFFLFRKVQCLNLLNSSQMCMRKVWVLRSESFAQDINTFIVFAYHYLR